MQSFSTSTPRNLAIAQMNVVLDAEAHPHLPVSAKHPRSYTTWRQADGVVVETAIVTIHDGSVTCDCGETGCVHAERAQLQDNAYLN